MTEDPDRHLLTLKDEETWIRASHLGAPLTPDELAAAILKDLTFAAKWEATDEVRHFSTSAASWAALGGRGGYVRLRGGRVVSLRVTSMS